jgi:predicted RND superfamily exporter protein
MVPEHAVWVLGLIALFTLASLTAIVDVRSGTPRLSLDPSLDSMLPREDEGRSYYERVKRLFDSGESILVVLVDDDIFKAENLARIQQMTERIEMLDQVDRVSSLSTALNIRGEDGTLLIEPFFEEVPESAEELADLRDRALNDPIYSGNLVSRDGRGSVVMVHLLDLPEQELIANRVDEEITRIAHEESGGADVWIAGSAHVKAEVARLMVADLSSLVPLSLVVMALIALASFRTIRGVVIPLLTVLISLVVTLAFTALFIGSLNIVTVAAPPILIVVGFAYAIHVVAAYYDVLWNQHGSELTRYQTIFLALRKVALAVIFTGVTTAVGFFSLTTSSLGAIRQFGVFCGVGVIVTMIVSLTFGPALMQILPDLHGIRARRSTDRFDRFLEELALFDLRWRRPILILGGVVAAVSLLGMFQIQVRTDMVSNFKRDNLVRRHFELVNDHLEGANAFDVVLETSYPDAFKDPVNLHVIEELQAWMESQPDVGGTTSIVDYVKVINQAFHDSDPAAYAVPETSDLVAQLLLIGANEELGSFVDTDYQTANIRVRTSAMDSSDVNGLVARIESHLSEVPAHLQARVTGNTVLVSKTVDELALGQALSLSTAFLFIFAILALLFTSWRSGFIALIPNVLPVLVYFGILGWTGVTLNTTTGLVACLVLGIAVDDTIHLMAEFNRAARRYADEQKGVVLALRSVGRPVTYTTVALCLGFLCLTLSSTQTQVEFGLLSACTLAIAWLIDVTFTPALATRMRVVNLWDVLTLDLGEEPHHSIPLFGGLRQTQARIIALMTSIQTFPSGHELFRIGDRGNEMYVVIDGELTASVPSVRGSVVLRTIRRGDVVGEVGLFHGQRIAHVVAVTDVQLLRLTQRNLRRLKDRYPRIAAQVFANMSSFLAERLATLTPRVR